MTATWTAPKTWADNDLVSADDLNEQVRDNLEALKDPPTDNYECDESTDYTTSSTSFVDVDGTNLALTITTNGGDVLVGFTGTVSIASGWRIHFDITVDGARQGGDDGICHHAPATVYGDEVGFAYLITGLDAGPHTIKLQWKVQSSTATLYAGAGTSGHDVHPQFWAREVS